MDHGRGWGWRSRLDHLSGLLFSLPHTRWQIRSLLRIEDMVCPGYLHAPLHRLVSNACEWSIRFDSNSSMLQCPPFYWPRSDVYSLFPSNKTWCTSRSHIGKIDQWFSTPPFMSANKVSSKYIQACAPEEFSYTSPMTIKELIKVITSKTSQELCVV